MTNPTARVNVTSTSKAVARLKLYGHGEDDRVVNEGDLLIVSQTYLSESNAKQSVDFEITVRGCDMFLLAEKAAKAVALYEENKDYLRSPATRTVSNQLPGHRYA